MSNQPGASIPQPTDSHRGLRLLGLAAVVIGVLLLMAAAFVLSYTGIHAVALSAGVSRRFARIYPVIFDAMLVVACAAVLSLRGAGLPSRCYAWLTMLVLLAAAAGADTLHATGTKLPHKSAAAAAAIIPWALVLVSFGLLLAMLRQARLRRAAVAAAPQRTFVQPSGHVEVYHGEVYHGIDELLGPTSSAGAPAARQAAQKNGPAADATLDLAVDADPALDDPASDEGHADALRRASWGPPGREQQPAAGHGSDPASAFSPAPTASPPIDTGTGTAGGSERGARPGAVPEARRAPEALPAPEAGPVPQAGPVPEAGPVQEDGAVHEDDSAPSSAERPEAGPVSGDGRTSGPAPASDARHLPQVGSHLGDGSGMAADAVPEPPASPELAEREATSAPTSVPGPATTSAPGPATAPAAGATPGPASASAQEAIPDPETQPTPAAPPPFERVRSSPVPPEG